MLRWGIKRLQGTDHCLKDPPSHPLEELPDEEHSEIPGEEREEDEARHGDERAQDRPAVAPALGYHAGELREQVRQNKSHVKIERYVLEHTWSPMISPTFVAPEMPFCQLAEMTRSPLGATTPNLSLNAGNARSIRGAKLVSICM